MASPEAEEGGGSDPTVYDPRPKISNLNKKIWKQNFEKNVGQNIY